jgi:hypothetical protein
MPQDRPMEIKRAKRGLGARTPEGESFPAKPKSRIPKAVRGTRRKLRPGRPIVPHGRPHGARAEHARQRTRQDNPEVGS